MFAKLFKTSYIYNAVTPSSEVIMEVTVTQLV
jgi:hypothetical protein